VAYLSTCARLHWYTAHFAETACGRLTRATHPRPRPQPGPGPGFYVPAWA
jgi:hypothetical protein